VYIYIYIYPIFSAKIWKISMYENIENIMTNIYMRNIENVNENAIGI